MTHLRHLVDQEGNQNHSKAQEDGGALAGARNVVMVIPLIAIATAAAVGARVSAKFNVAGTGGNETRKRLRTIHRLISPFRQAWAETDGAGV